MKKIIVIIGGARSPGRALLRAIVNGNGEFAARAVARDVAGEDGRYLAARGAEVVTGQMGDEASLRRAFQGAFGAFYLLLPEESRFPQKKLHDAEAMARAARDAGLQHVIWATLEGTSLAPRITENDDTPVPTTDGWLVTQFDAKAETAKVFTRLGVPTTYLHVSGPSPLATGKWAEEIGNTAYTMFGNPELVGKTVLFNAGQVAPEVRREPTAGQVAPEVRREPAAGPLASEVRRAPAKSPPQVPIQPIQPPPRRNRTPYLVGAALLLLLSLVAVGVKSVSEGHKPDLQGAVAATDEARPVPSKPAPIKPSIEPMVGEPIVARTQPEPEPEREPAAPAVRPGMPARHLSRTGEPATAKRLSLNRRFSSEAPRSVLDERPPSSPADAFAVPPPPAPPAEAAPPGEPAAKLVAAKLVAAKLVAAKPVDARPVDDTPVASTSPAAAPRPTVAAPLSPGTVSTKAIAATVRAHAAEVQACYDRALMDGGDLHGRLTVNAVLDPGGRVLSVSPSSTVEGGARLRACVVEAFKTWTFPAPAGGAKGNITYSFSFQ